jgi:ketosteroid isomerase-like protein
VSDVSGDVTRASEQLPEPTSAELENVQVVRDLMSAFNRRDIEKVLALVDPTVAFFAPQTASAVGQKMMYRGHDGMRHYFHQVGQVWQRLQLNPYEFQAKGECVVVTGRISGDRNGMRIDSHAAWGWRLRNGKVVWGRSYESSREAFEDTGVPAGTRILRFTS